MRPRNYLYYGIQNQELSRILSIYKEIVLNMFQRYTRIKEIYFWSSFVISITGSWEVSVQYTFLEDIEDMVSIKELEQTVKIMLKLC